MCTTILDPTLIVACSRLVEQAVNPWLVRWHYGSVGAGEDGLREFQPTRIRAAVIEHLTSVGLHEAPWLGRMSPRAYVGEADLTRVQFGVEIVAVLDAPDAGDLTAQLGAPSGHLRLLNVVPLRGARSRDRQKLQSELNDVLHTAVILLFEPVGDELQLAEVARDTLEVASSRAWRAMLRHWVPVEYADLYVSTADPTFQ